MNKLKAKKGLFSIKVDLVKAYGMLNWKFVEGVLKELCIPQHLMHIIMSVVNSISMRVF